MGRQVGVGLRLGLGFGVRGGLLGGSWHHHSTTESRGWLLAPPFHHRVSPFHHHSTPKSRHSTTIPPQSLTIPPPFHPWGWGWGCGCGCGWGWVGVRGWGWPPGRLLGVSWAVGCPLLVLLGGVFWFSLVFLRFCLVFLAWGASSGSRPFLLGLGPGAWRSWIGLLGGVLAPSGRLLGAIWRLLGASWLPLGGPRAGNPQNCDSLAFLLGKWRQFLTVLGETSGAYFRPATWVGSRDPAEPWVVFFGVNSTQPEVREAGGNFALL